MATMDTRITDLIKQMLLKAIREKILPQLREDKPELQSKYLERAADLVKQKVAKILDRIPIFDPDLLLSKIPSLEFLELLIVSEYLYLQAVENGHKRRGFHPDPDLIAALKKILNAYGIYTSDELEAYRDVWRESWHAPPPNNVDRAFEQLKEAFEEAAME